MKTQILLQAREEDPEPSPSSSSHCGQDVLENRGLQVSRSSHASEKQDPAQLWVTWPHVP